MAHEDIFESRIKSKSTIATNELIHFISDTNIAMQNNSVKQVVKKHFDFEKMLKS